MADYEEMKNEKKADGDGVRIHGNELFSTPDTLKETLDQLHGCDYIITMDFAGGKVNG